MENKEQEITARFAKYEQQIRQLQQQFQAVEESIVELNILDLGLDNLSGKVGEEIMAPIGRGIFVKAELKSEELTVDIGNQNLVKKSIPETKKILKTQITKLGEIKKELENKMDEIQEEAKEFIMGMQGEE